MCGIVGFIDPDVREKSVRLRRMLCAMQARGPDDEGMHVEDTLAMGMRRLAVIDVDGGRQPLTSRAGRVLAFQNGEIYNHAELRAELAGDGYAFCTRSDTEVLAHGYDRWGLDGLLARIDGMFALAILDKDVRQLHLARDRFGEKPLYYTGDGTRFAYASDLRILAALPWFDGDIDRLSLSRYLALHYIPGDRTVLSGIHRVLPGECLTLAIDTPRPQRKRYYRLALRREVRLDDDELAAGIECAVASRLVSDVPVGVFLSGGLDSAIVAALAARRVRDLATFSIGFHSAQHDESPFARQMAASIGSRHHHFVFDDAAFATLLPRVAGALDEPLGDQAALPLFWLCREARRHVTVVLAGEGADEVFAGYGYYAPFASAAPWWKRLRTRMRGQQLARMPVSLIGETAPFTPSGFPLLTGVDERKMLLGLGDAAGDDWECELLGWLAHADDPLQRATATDLATWLPDDLLVKFDRMAMAHGLEGRAPFLQPDLVTMGVTRLTPAQRMNGGESKVALRRVARRWLPPEIFKRRKQGFVLPMAGWLRQWFAAAGGVEGWLERVGTPYFERSVLQRVVQNELAAGVRRERLLFALVMFHEWHERFTRHVAALRREYANASGGADAQDSRVGKHDTAAASCQLPRGFS